MSIAKHAQVSAMRKNAVVPTLAQMILDGQQSSKKIKRASEEALREWIKQSERLNIARKHYRLRGERFINFARRIGVDKSSAYALIKLWKHRAAITSRCLDMAEEAAAQGEPFAYPGWLTALGWFEEPSKRITNPYEHGRLPDNDSRPTPQYIFDWIAKEFGPFDLDVAATAKNAKCARYFTKEQNGLVQPWEGNVWMNPPYNNVEAWVRKAWEYAQTGKGTVTALLPVWTDAGWFDDYASHGRIFLLRGRIRFQHGETGSAPFPNMLVRWEKRSNRRGALLSMSIIQRPHAG